MAKVDQQRLELEASLGNKYEVLRHIGGGGMAQVFLARHRLHGGLVAIKVLADHLAQDPRIVGRFGQEARTAASLSGHPNIIPIFDIGEDNGLHYLIMQYVSGEDMGSYLRREGKLQPAFAANIIAQTAEGLAWSASKRVVHRDLKPSNILLDVSGRAILLDFGISKIADIANGLTRPGESLGTPYYMSPEQIRGEGCDARSDLYSLGVVFFELLTGSRPFESESSTAIQMAHLSVSPPSLLQYDSNLPAACEHIVQKLLQKLPEDRYQTPQELLDELHALGASSGASTLRPYIDPSIATDLIEALPVTIVEMNPSHAGSTAPAAASIASGTVASGSGSAASGTQATGSVAAEPPPAPILRPEPAIAPDPVPGSHRRMAWFIAAASTSAVCIVAIVLLLLSGPGTNAPKTITDAHGRMLLVPAGKFIFGDSSAESGNPRQALSLPAFYVDETEVSNAEYRRFCEATGHAPPDGPDYSAYPDHPVADVTVEDAEAYALWAGKRLPTEQEWEKAARGTDGRPYPWGSDAWTQDVPTQLQPVSSFEQRKSPWGALNMAGNVYEWTASRYPLDERQYADMQSLLKTTAVSKSWYIIKGGSFAPQKNSSFFFASYLRRGFPSGQRSPWIGFRCVRDAPQRGWLARLKARVSK